MVKDWAYKTIFKRKDLPSLQDMVKHIHETHDTDMIENINQRFEDEAKTLDNGIEILQITKTEDLVVNVGLQQCINIILGISTTRFTHIELTQAGGGAPAVTDTALGTPGGGRLALVPNGWIEPEGMKLFFGSIVPEWVNDAPNPISEMGIFNASSGGTMLNREQFLNNQVLRVDTASAAFLVYDSVAIMSCVIEFCPVAD